MALSFEVCGDVVGVRSRDGMRAGMVRIPGGTFLMGSNDFYPEERPVHRVTVDRFWMDEHPVTNAEFRRFVHATGYTAVAERAPIIRKQTARCLFPALWFFGDPRNGCRCKIIEPGGRMFRVLVGAIPKAGASFEVYTALTLGR